MTLATRPKPPVHHKKRHGQHQKHSKHFKNTYWPYLPMLLVVVLSVAFSAIWSEKSNVLGSQSDLSTSSLLSSTNMARDSNHEQALTENQQLDAAAQAKANDMVTRNYWSHEAPDGKTPWDFIIASGYTYQKAGENLAYGFSSSDSAIKAWLNSPEHRANLLGTEYTQVGFGVASSPNYQGSGPETVVVAMYGAPISSTVGVAAAVPPQQVKGAVAPVKAVSRVQLLATNHAPWALFAVTTIAVIGFVAVLFNHARAWHRVWVRSEAFVLHHPLLDITLVAAVSLAAVLTRVTGYIG